VTRDRVNRVLLLIVGAVLVAGGVYALLRSFSAFGSEAARDPLLSSTLRRRVERAEDWFWPLVALGCAIVVVSALAWLWTQRPRPLPSDDLVYEEADHSTTVRSSALSRAVQDELQQQPAVDSARVGIDRSPESTVVLARLTVEDGTSARTVATEIVAPAIEHFRRATGDADATGRAILEYTAPRRSVG
jgi:hypothetical protein